MLPPQRCFRDAFEYAHQWRLYCESQPLRHFDRILIPSLIERFVLFAFETSLLFPLSPFLSSLFQCTRALKDSLMFSMLDSRFALCSVFERAICIVAGLSLRRWACALHCKPSSLALTPNATQAIQVRGWTSNGICG